MSMTEGDLVQRQAKHPQFAYLELLSLRVVRIALATTAIFVGLFTVVGPIGTYVTFTLLQRLVYCGVLAVLGLPIYYCTMAVALYYTRFQSRSACTLAVVAVIALAAIPVTAMAYVLHVTVYPDSPIPDLAALYLSAAAAAISASLLFSYVIFQRIPAADTGAGESVATSDTDGLSGGAMPETGAIDRDLEGSPNPQTQPQAANGALIDHRLTTPQVPFLRRLPADARGEIIYLTTKTHYIQVYTTAGRARLLLRFADAVAELGDLGMQVHRSYWVALAQVTDMVRRDNRTVLRLTGDHEVPVSRTYLKAVKAALSN